MQVFTLAARLVHSQGQLKPTVDVCYSTTCSNRSHAAKPHRDKLPKSPWGDDKRRQMIPISLDSGLGIQHPLLEKYSFHDGPSIEPSRFQQSQPCEAKRLRLPSAFARCCSPCRSDSLDAVQEFKRNSINARSLENSHCYSNRWTA